MNRFIIICCLAIPMFFACTKDGDNTIAQKNEYTLVKNKYRAVEITGKNKHWGEYKLTLSYRNELLDTARRYNANEKYKGYIRLKLNSKSNYEYTINDFVPKVDQDSINRLDAKLKAKHGEGNYSLEDSIPISGQSLRKYQIVLDEAGRISKQIVIDFLPNPGTGSGADFDYAYKQKRQLTNRYEYNDAGNIIAERIFEDIFDLNDKEIYVRSIHKNEFNYDATQLSSIVKYTAPEGNNFVETNRYNFIYNNNKLVTITEEGLDKKITYNGETVSTIVCNGITYTYEFDNNGNVTQINDGQGNYMKIKYESGHGNIAELLLQLEKMMGDPYIK